MIRQIFIAPIKDGVSEEMVQERIKAQIALKDHVAGIQTITVNKAMGLYGMTNAVVMTIDLKDMEAWDNLLASEYHTSLGNAADIYFDVDGCVAAQVESNEQ